MRKKEKLIAILVFIAIAIAYCIFVQDKAMAISERIIEFTEATPLDATTVAYDINGKQVTAQVGQKIEEVFTPEEINSGEHKEVRAMTEDYEGWFIKIQNPEGEPIVVQINGGDVQPDEFGFINLQGLEGNVMIYISPVHGYGDDARFDGEAYFAWVDGEGDLCYHKFELEGGNEIQNEHGDWIRVYPINYIELSDLTDESGNDCDYQWEQDGPANWVLARDIENNEGEVVADAYDVFGNGQDNMGLQLDPCGGRSGVNSMSTNGDRNFRATIYRDGYEAITFNASEDAYEYFPGFWDPVFYSDTLDVSGTSKDNPAFYEAYLIEPTISFSTGALSEAQIVSVKALDVNEGAVEVTKSGSAFNVEFKSNYYDKVVFELTDENEETYYIMISRIVMQIHDNLGPDSTEDPKLISEFYYPTTYTYNDFEILATIDYRDGSTETVKAEVAEYVDVAAGLEPVNTYTGNGGKNLYVSQFTIDLDDSIQNVFFTVIRKGALEGEEYGGTFSGSGKGVNYSVEDRSVIY